MVLDDFSNWMNENSKLSESSVYKYKRALNTISNEMQESKVIHKSLLNMSLTELDVAVFAILNNSQFIAKNQKGNHMYSNALKQYRLFALDCFDDESDELALVNEIKQSILSQTEKETLIKARIGQGIYREELIKKYDSKCVMTGIDSKKLLIASHIKPWSICTNEERIDINNGLLLCANMDKLFDSGLITFENDGRLHISSFLGKENEKRLHIESNMCFDLKATNIMKNYHEYHRDVLYVK